MESSSDFQICKESLIAAARGPFFPDQEFATLFGQTREEAVYIADSFSAATPLSGQVACALNNAMNNLLGYPHGQDAAWPQWLSVTPEELQAVFMRWRASAMAAGLLATTG
jgi:hypothetical protein